MEENNNVQIYGVQRIRMESGEEDKSDYRNSKETGGRLLNVCKQETKKLPSIINITLCWK